MFGINSTTLTAQLNRIYGVDAYDLPRDGICFRLSSSISINPILGYKTNVKQIIGSEVFTSFIGAISSPALICTATNPGPGVWT